MFGNNDSFQPENKITKEHLKGMIVKEGMEMELFRPFQKLEAILNKQTTERMLRKSEWQEQQQEIVQR